jgi:hypothetical protein
MPAQQNMCGGVSYSLVAKCSLGVSCLTCSFLVGRQMVLKRSQVDGMLPLYFRLMVITLASAVALGMSQSIQDEHSAFWLGTLAQGLAAGTSVMIGLYLGQGIGGSRALYVSIAGGAVFAAEQCVFQEVMLMDNETTHETQQQKSSQQGGHKAIRWMLQDSLRVLIFIGILIIAKRQHCLRVGILMYCFFEIVMFSCWIIAEALYLQDQVLASQCVHISVLAVYVSTWPWVLYYALQRDSSFWRFFPLASLDVDDKSVALLGNADNIHINTIRPQLNERVKVLDFCNVVLGKKIGQGGEASVFKGSYNLDGNKVPCAVKCISLDLFDRGMIRDALIEANILSQVRHPNVIW